jgi:hypothetical protein
MNDEVKEVAFHLSFIAHRSSFIVPRSSCSLSGGGKFLDIIGGSWYDAAEQAG